MRKYCAVIVEPREHKALCFVLNNFLKNLSDEWFIVIMHGNNNNNYIDSIISNDLFKYKNRIAKINLLVDNLKIQEYNQLMVSEYFYNIIPTKTFLIFQTDTMICEKNKDLINNFLEYDYVGAPWKALMSNGQLYSVGNGGLSLRTKKACLDCIKNNKWNGENEDMFFSKNIKNIPSFENAKSFSVETCYSDITFGLHKPWYHLPKYELQSLMTQFNELDKLMELNYYFEYK